MKQRKNTSPPPKKKPRVKRGAPPPEVLQPGGPAASPHPPVPPSQAGSSPTPTVTPIGRTRTEIRVSCAAVFDGVLRTKLERAVELMTDDDLRDMKKVAAVQQVAQLYAQVGVGFIGTATIDPATIPNLPAPVFQTLDPNAPLPDGKPG